MDRPCGEGLPQPVEIRGRAEDDACAVGGGLNAEDRHGERLGQATGVEVLRSWSGPEGDMCPSSWRGSYPVRRDWATNRGYVKPSGWHDEPERPPGLSREADLPEVWRRPKGVCIGHGRDVTRLSSCTSPAHSTGGRAHPANPQVGACPREVERQQLS